MLNHETSLRKSRGENISIFSDSTPAGSAVAAAVAGQVRAAGDAVKLCHLPQAKAIGGNRYITHPYHFTRSPYMDPSSPESQFA